MNQINLKNALQDIINDKPNSIKAFIAHEALESENPKEFFTELSQYGCVSGMIPSLIYYADTHKFFDKYYNEIEELRFEYEDEIEYPIEIKGDLKNFYVWFTIEMVAWNMMTSFGLD